MLVAALARSPREQIPVKRRLAAIIEQVVGEECDQSQVRDELNHFSRVLGSSLPAP